MDEADDDEGGGSDLEDEISLSGLCLCTRCYEDGQYEEAIFAGQTCLGMATEKGNEDAVMTACLVIGESEFELKEYEDAVSHLTSMEVAAKYDDFEVVMKTCLTLGKAHCALGNYDEAITYARRCSDIANEIASGLLYEGKASLVLSEVYCALGKYEGVISFGMRALNIGKEIGDIYTETMSYRIIAEAYKALKFNDESLEYAWCIDVANDKQVRMKACYFFMTTYESLKQYKEALRYAEICLGFVKEMGNKRAELETLRFIANAHFAADNYTEAVRYAQLCLEVAKETEDKREEMDACSFIANTQRKAGNFTEAVRYAQLWLEVAKETNEEMDACSFIANTQCEAGNFTEAVRYAQLCLEVAKETKDKREEMDACSFIAIIQCEAGNFTEAVRYAKLTLELARETGDQGSEMKACQLIAITQFIAGNFTEAVPYAKLTLELARETGDQGSEMKACDLIANTQRKAGNFTEAVPYAKLTLELARETGDQGSETEACKLIANTQCEAGNFTEALKFGLMCVDVATEIGDKRSEIDACLIIGNAGRALESSDEILQYATKRMTMEQESDGGGNKKIGCLLLGLVHCNKYDVDTLSHLEKAIDYAREDKDEYGEMKIYHCLEVTHCHLQQIHKAISCCEKSIQIAKNIGANEWEMECSLRLAQLYKMVNRNDQVELHASTALEIAKKLGDKEIQRDANICLGEVYSKSGQDSKASACFNESVNIAKQTGNPFTEMFAISLAPFSSFSEVKKRMEKVHDMFKGFSLPLHTITETDFEGLFSFGCSIIHDFLMQLIKFCADEDFTKEFPKLFEKIMQQLKPQNSLEFSFQPLIHSLEKSINVLPLKTEEKTAARKACHLLAEHQRSANIYPTSLKEFLISLRKQFKIVLELFKVCEDVFCFQATCHSIVGMTHYLLNDVQNAKASFIETKKCFESLFNGAGVDKSKISIVDRYADIYKLLSIILIQEGKTEEALAMAENCRAKALKDILVVMYGLDKEFFQDDYIQFDDMLPVLKAEKSSILFYTVSFHGIHKFVMEDGKNLQFSEQPLIHPDLIFKNLIKEVYEELKVSGGFHYSNPLWVSRTLQILERDDEWKELIEPLNVGELEECDWEELDDLTKKAVLDIVFEDPGYKRLEENTTPSPFDAIEGESSFTSALDALSHRLLDNVCLEQDEVVIIPDGLISIVPFAALTNPATGNYLSEDKKIRFAPSLTTLKMLSESREDFHTLKDAIFIGNPDVSRVPCDGESLKQLPFAEKEVKAIARLYFNDVTPLIGAQATKRVVLEKLRKGASVIHIAAHGDLDKATILLAPDPDVQGVPDEKDYMLTMADVQQAQVHAQLVVLSCCYSGRGEIKTEGVVGLCRAFLASGARAVVSSLWAIDDAASHVFMVEFYGYLQDGNSASASLQMATKEIREIEEYSEPRFWAPFFLMGDDVTIKF